MVLFASKFLQLFHLCKVPSSLGRGLFDKLAIIVMFIWVIAGHVVAEREHVLLRLIVLIAQHYGTTMRHVHGRLSCIVAC